MPVVIHPSADTDGTGGGIRMATLSGSDQPAQAQAQAQAAAQPDE